VRTMLLLTISNILMTFAWYSHLKYRNAALWKVIMASWGIAFFEYCFQVPANRIGSYEFNTVQLKTIQEVITLTVFAVFSATYLGERLKWNYGVGAACLLLGVFFVFHMVSPFVSIYPEQCRANRIGRFKAFMAINWRM
jgi:hypothetical protein